MAAPGRLELSTLRLTAACSTDWAKGQWKVATTYPPGVEAQVLSAWESLTSVFGMGTGGSSLLSSPPWYIKPLPRRNIMAVTDQCFPPYLGFTLVRGFSSARLDLLSSADSQLNCKSATCIFRKVSGPWNHRFLVPRYVSFCSFSTFVEIKPSTY